MYVCITDGAGKILVHKNLRSNPDSFARVIEPYREDLVVAQSSVSLSGTGWLMCALNWESSSSLATRYT